MNLVKFFKQVFSLFSRDKVGQLSAAFAYIVTFSLGPLLIVLITAVGFIFGHKAVEGTLFSQLSGTFGANTAKTLQTVVANTHRSNHTALALVAGMVGLALSATGITVQLQNSFNAIFEVVPDPKGGIKRTVYVKLKNILLIIVGGTFVMASVISSTIIIGLAKKISQQTGLPPFFLEIIDNLVSLLLFVLVLYLIYKILPDVRIPKKVVLTASFVVSILFIAGKILLGIIIGRNGTVSAYGAAASLVTLLLWIFYSGQILFLGAEGMKAYGQNKSLIYIPKKYNLKRNTITLDSKGLKANLFEAYLRGVRKKRKPGK